MEAFNRSSLDQTADDAAGHPDVGGLLPREDSVLGGRESTQLDPFFSLNHSWIIWNIFKFTNRSRIGSVVRMELSIKSWASRRDDDMPLLMADRPAA